MKRAVAIILSLTMIWLQMLASAQTLCAAPAESPVPAKKCGCCAAQKTCCVTASDSPATPLPAAPVPAGHSVDFHVLLAKVLVWTLPAAAPTAISASDSSIASIPAVPLFQRNCALLI